MCVVYQLDGASVDKGESGFRTTGIYPIDPSVFIDKDYVVADVLNDPGKIAVFDDGVNGDISSAGIPKSKNEEPVGSPKQCCSSENKAAAIPSTSKSAPSLNCSDEDLLPKPKKNTKVTKPNRRPKQQSSILPYTSLKDALEEKEEKKKAKLEKTWS
ncbi:hypothetical protein JTB14_018776 [Gonioctena quinquepunctata]|nr:hypothetical protein JTB14_018776 [Gonioctena quinquepunctata]